MWYIVFDSSESRKQFCFFFYLVHWIGGSEGNNFSKILVTSTEIIR